MEKKNVINETAMYDLYIL